MKGSQGPIFEDGPNFALAFKLFHGQNGMVPLSGQTGFVGRDFESSESNSEPTSVKFHPLAASAATISLSALGTSGPFGFDAFMSKRIKMNQPEKRQQHSEKASSSFEHEALGSEWLKTGNCPIAKSFRAVSGALPLVAKMLQPPAGMKLRCPPAVVAARAALARTAAVKVLRPQPLSTKVLVIGLLGMAANVPLGIWREHTEKFSPAWFTAVHASVPFIAMLRKAVHMPKYAMVYTIAASILGQVIGSRAERKRMEYVQLRDVALNKLPEVMGECVSLPTARKEGLPSEMKHMEYVQLRADALIMVPDGVGKSVSARNEGVPSEASCENAWLVPCSQESEKETWNSFAKTNSSADPVSAF